MDNEYSTIYIVGSETNQLFEYVGKVAVASAVGYFTVKGIKCFAKSKEMKSLIDKVKSR